MAISHKHKARRPQAKRAAPKRDAQQAGPAGPLIGDYTELKQVLPTDYHPLLDPRETQLAVFAVKSYIEERLCQELNLMMVTAPLVLDVASGLDDMLDRDESRTAVQFHISNDGDKHPIDAQVVQAATKWKRMALRQFGMQPGEGLCADLRGVRKDYFLDHDHGCSVDLWTWERVIAPEDRGLVFLTGMVRQVWNILRGAERFALEQFPKLRDPRYPELPDELTFLHAEDVLEMFPDQPREQRESMLLQKHPAAFIYGIGWPLKNGEPHRRRAADCDDWVTETTSQDGRPMHGLSGDLLVWNPVTRGRHRLGSMGIRVNAETLKRQLEMRRQLHLLASPYHRGVIDGTLPPSIGGAVRQSRALMLILRKAHLGEVTVSVWPKVLKEMCAERNIVVLE